MNHLFLVFSLQKPWFHVQRMFIKVLFIHTNIVQSQSLTINHGFFYMVWIRGTTLQVYWLLALQSAIFLEPWEELPCDKPESKEPHYPFSMFRDIRTRCKSHSFGATAPSGLEGGSPTIHSAQNRRIYI